MKDIHTHLLPGIDDGATTQSESIKLLRELEERGVSELVLTPHYIEDSKYTCNVAGKNELLESLKNKLTKEKINIKLYIGNEVYFSQNILSLLENKEISSINNSKYLLIELPILNMPSVTKNVFSELICSGYKVILAHPERYLYVMNNIDILDEFIRMGIILQGDYMSLFGKYGKGAKQTLKKLLRNDSISLLASDTHHVAPISEKKLRKKLEWYVSKKNIEKLLNSNFDKIINNKDL